MTDTRILLIEPNDKEFERIGGALRLLGHNTVTRARSIKEALPELIRSDAIIAALDLPDISDASEALRALCEARSATDPRVIVVVNDPTDSSCPYIWERTEDCVASVLFREQISPGHLDTALKSSLVNSEGSQKQNREEHNVRTRHSYSVGYPIESVDSKLNRVLDELQRQSRELAEIKFAMATQSTRVLRLEDAQRDSIEDRRRLRRVAKRVTLRLKSLDTLLVGDLALGTRSLVVRLEDLERHQKEQTQAEETWQATLRQGLIQLSPVILSGAAALLLLVFSWKAQQTVEQAHAVVHAAIQAKEATGK